MPRSKTLRADESAAALAEEPSRIPLTDAAENENAGEGVSESQPTWPYVLRLIGSSLLLLAIIANMVMIFLFSAESISESSDRSTGVIMKLAEILFKDFDDLNWLEKEQLYSAMATPVRKLAHLTEFATLGFLTGAFLMPVRRKQRWVPWVIPALFCLVYASSDEIHQIFSGRGPSVRDVLIDFVGALLGLCLVHFMWMLIRSIFRNGRHVRHAQRKKRAQTAVPIPAPLPAPALPAQADEAAGKGRSKSKKKHKKEKKPVGKKQETQEPAAKVPFLLRLLRLKVKEKPARLKRLSRDAELPHVWYGNGGRFAKAGRVRHRPRI